MVNDKELRKQIRELLEDESYHEIEDYHIKVVNDEIFKALLSVKLKYKRNSQAQLWYPMGYNDAVKEAHNQIDKLLKELGK